MEESRAFHSMPPSPELADKIRLTKKMIFAGESLPSKITVDVLDMRSFTLITGIPKWIRTHTLTPRVQSAAPLVGTRKALVLLVDFSDKAAKEKQQHYKDMLFSQGTYPTGSLCDYYWEASYNKLRITGEVSGDGGKTAGWHRAPQSYSYYANGNYGIYGDYPQNAQKLVEDIVDLAANYVKFSDYDNDGDGFVDALFIVHAGQGAEVTGNVNDIWSHQWSIKPKTVDGVKVCDYSMEPEDGNIGVFCHELGHVFGLPDLYDYGYDSAGVGTWDIMAAGSWNNGGLTPAHFGSWCKIKLGWLDPVVIFNKKQTVAIKPYTNNAQVYKLPIKNENSKEYYLIENRRQLGFDKYLPGQGAIILHVDENQQNNDDQNHYLVDIEQCDGRSDLNKNANRGDATDAYPSGGNAEFTINSTPSCKAYNGTDSGVAVTNIKLSGEDITADISVILNTGNWYSNKKVTATFAHYTSQWAWASIDSLGWKRIKEGSPDGVNNLFFMMCEAKANDKLVTVYIDENDLITTAYLL